MSGQPAGPAADPVVAVVGSLNMDLVIRVPELPGPGETASGGDLFRNPEARAPTRRWRRPGSAAGWPWSAASATTTPAAACLRQGARASLPTPAELDTLPEPSRP